MNRTLQVIALVSVAAGCAVPGDPDGDESVELSDQALNGILIKGAGPLTITSLQNGGIERSLEFDTAAYYARVGVAADGGDGGKDRDGKGKDTIATRLKNLDSFKTFYGFNRETKATYYNRGDLGIGREMHCTDRVNVANDGQVACYVKNFFAGDANTEFAFGLSSNIAFANMNAGAAFATVAMVFRKNASPEDQVFFVVYGADEKLASAPAAPLDRHGLNFNKEFVRLAQQGDKNPRPDPTVFGTPGTNFNNHIPSNCLSCHGGSYTSDFDGNNIVLRATFLPFDLDQFDYQDAPKQTRDEQLDSFKRLNQMVRDVALNTGRSSMVAQIDGWYNNPQKQFDSTYVPPGWRGSAAAKNIYRSVVRPYCRNCHTAVSRHFDTETEFLSRSRFSAPYICANVMPHALQTIRGFWQSNAPAELEAYFRLRHAVGVDGVSAADLLHDCRPGDVVTLDPQLIGASAVPM
jgi:hypothetical protein